MKKLSRAAVSRLLGHTSIALLVVTVVALLAAGPGHRFGVLGLGAAFSALAVSAFAAVLLVLAGCTAAWMTLRRRMWGMAAGAIVGAVVGLGLTANNLSWFARASNTPVIHDITTDVRNPPNFVALVSERADAPNSVEYAGRETGEAQLIWYPDVRTLHVPRPFSEVFALAEASAHALGWEVVLVEETDGRIEATDTTPFFGFKDDIAIRVRQRAGVTIVDLRSKSRVGAGDLGTNARRIRAFSEELMDRL